MSTLRFNTTIKCSGCLARITAVFNEINDIQSWSVDILHPSKLLTVTSDSLMAEDIIRIVESAGFKAELIQS